MKEVINFKTAHPRAEFMNWKDISRNIKDIFENENEDEQKILDLLDYESKHFKIYKKKKKKKFTKI